MSHNVTIVDDDALPEGHDFLFVDHPAGAHIFYRRSTLGAQSIRDSWTAGRAVQQRKPTRPPIARDHRAEIVNMLRAV